MKPRVDQVKILVLANLQQALIAASEAGVLDQLLVYCQDYHDVNHFYDAVCAMSEDWQKLTAPG